MAHDYPVSPLAQPLPSLFPMAGVRIGSIEAGIRYQGRADLVMMEFAPQTTVAGVFTRNQCPGAPVDWCRKHLPGGLARALVVNAGNANVFTGQAGEETTRATADAASILCGCAAEQVFLASTGVIGEILPHERITNALPALHKKLQENGWQDAARAIMTTDTFPKAASCETQIDGTAVRIQGIAKGSGMIAPDMATMLCFVVTDAALPPSVLQALLDEGVRHSFNMISVDSDTSTSDTVLLFATGQRPTPPVSQPDDPRIADFRAALHRLLLDLALLVVRDGEGATKLIRINVTGATSEQSARSVALSVANSPLVKTAVAGEDANWGRIVMAVGKSGEKVNRDTLGISIGGTRVAQKGQVVKGYDEAPVSAHMKEHEVCIDIDIGLGQGQATAWSCDLTHAYIDINGSYRS